MLITIRQKTETQCDLLNSLPVCSLCISDLNCVSISNCYSDPSSGSNYSSQFSFEQNSWNSELEEYLISLSLNSSLNPATAFLRFKRPASESQLSPHKQYNFKDLASVDRSKTEPECKKVDTLSEHEAAKPNQNRPYQSTLKAKIFTLVDKNPISLNQLSSK